MPLYSVIRCWSTYRVTYRVTLTCLISVILMISLMACGSISDPLPKGLEGMEAEKLADRMLAVIKADTFYRAEGAQWSFRDHHYIWHRGLGRVRVKLDEELFVYLDLNTQQGWALEKGKRSNPKEEKEHVSEAIKAFNNDSFWAFAPFKIRDPGTSRAIVTDTESERSSLLIFYKTGGSTPGDHYLWHLDAEGRPESWQMWVSIIPVGGVRTTWSDWKQTQSGAWVATKHRFSGSMSLNLPDLEVTERFEELKTDATLLLGNWPTLTQ